MLEQWKPIPGYEGLYSVSDHGRVRSEKRVLVSPGGESREWPERILAGSITPVPHITGRGRKYPCVTLWREAMQAKFRIHALVLLAFVGPRPDGAECLHADDDPNNNRLTNLRYGTHAENGRDIAANRIRCINGHQFSTSNTYIRKDTGTRQCRQCCRDRQQKQRSANPQGNLQCGGTDD